MLTSPRISFFGFSLSEAILAILQMAACVVTTWSLEESIPQDAPTIPLAAASFTQIYLLLAAFGLFTLIAWFFSSGKRQSMTALRSAVRSGVGKQGGTEKALRESAGDLNTILAKMMVGVAVNINNRYVFTNAALEQILGYSEEEFQDLQSIEQLIHEEDRALVHRRYTERLAGIHPHADPVEVRYRHKNGHDVWVQVSGLLITCQGERATLATFVDISERKCAEEAMRHARKNLDVLLDTMPVSIAVNQYGKYIFVNKELCTILGYEKEELLALPEPWDLIHPDDKLRTWQRYQERKDGVNLHRELEDVRYRRKNGDYLWVAAAGIQMLYEGNVATLVTMVDATERKNAEEQVCRIQENQKKILETMGVGVAVTRGEQILFANEALSGLSGFSKEEMYARDLCELMHPESAKRARERIRARMQGEILMEHYEERIFHKNGTLLWVEIMGFLCDYEGMPAVISSFVDITERKNAMAQLEHSSREKDRLLVEVEKQKNMVLRSFIQGQEDERFRIAQDLHDGVGHLLSIVKIGLSSFEENVQVLAPERLEEFRHFLRIYDQGVQEVRAVSHQLMPTTLRKMGLKAALQDLATMLTLSGKIRVDVALEALDTLTTELDNELATSIFRIVQELSNNTVKYAQASAISIQIINNDGFLMCIYEDDGIGFDVQNVSRGIGLNNIRNRVLLLSGTAEFDSAPGNGMVATIEIPVYPHLLEKHR